MAASHPLGRKLWFQIHKWIGIILAILIIPLSLSGSALVWHDALDRAVNPGRYPGHAKPAALQPSAYAAAARAALPPGLRIVNLVLPGDPGDPVTVTASKPPVRGEPARPGPPVRTTVYLDPADGHVLAVAASNSGLVRTLHALHGNLLVPGVGRQIVGWIGVAMLISSLSGLWLWWPSVGKWTRGLRWRRQPAFDGNLHHQIGFWIALPLAMLSLTGAWIAFPAFFGMLSGAAGQQGGGADRARQFRAQPVEAPRSSPDAVLAAAVPLGKGAPRTIIWPTDQSPAWRVAFAGVPGQRIPEVSVADDSGRAEAPKRGGERAGPQPGVARLMRRLHDGTGMGPVWQTIIFIGGIAPAVLAVTGILMWLRTRRWRGAAGRRTSSRRAVAAE